MQNLLYTPNDAEIEQAYDTQSEFELQNCSKLESFVGKAKDFHRRVKKFFTTAKDKITGTFCMGDPSSASHNAQNSPRPSPPVQDIKSLFDSALNEAITKVNAKVSNSHNQGNIILQPDEVADLAVKLDALMMNDLGQKHISTPLTAQQQDSFYFQAGNEFIQRILDVNCFVETVKAYLAMPP
jgi:hypothetical protein